MHGFKDSGSDAEADGRIRGRRAERTSKRMVDRGVV